MTPAPVDHSGTVRSLRGLQRYAAGVAPGWTALLALLVVANAAVTLMLPGALGRAVDAALTGRNGAAALGVLGLFVAALAADVVVMWADAACRAAIQVPLRRWFAEHVLAVGIRAQWQFGAGDLASRMVAGGRDAAAAVPAVLAPVGSVLIAAGGMVALALIDWRLVTVFALWVPVAVFVSRRFVRRYSELSQRYQQLQGELSERLVEAAAGARTIAASGTLGREVERVLTPLPRLAATGRASWDAQRRATWTMSLVVPLAEVTVLAVAGVRVARGQMTAGDWVAAAGYVTVALRFLEVIDPLLDLSRVRAGLARLAEVLGLPLRRSTGTGSPAPGPGALALRSVTVRSQDRVLLDSVSLDIRGGETVAVVGGSGAGKSTLAAVLGGLLVPDDGVVLLDGVPVPSLPPAYVRRTVAYAFERPVLFGRHLHDAIAAGRPDVTREQVVAAAVAASADQFIRRLPDGYDTALEEARFSGGEVQRLGLARAVLADSRVLILDDAMSSVDTVTESRISAALTGLLGERTCVLITHRLATAARADAVVWMEGARIRGVGTHERLCEDAAYRALFSARPADVGAVVPAELDREPTCPTVR